MGLIGIELEQAVEIIAGQTNKISEKELISVWDAGGRRLAQDLTAAFDQPPFPRSPLDGYAFAAEVVKGATKTMPVELAVIERICAGEYSDKKIGPGEAVRIMTGAPIPAGCNCVIRQEDVTVHGFGILIDRELKPFENYCFAGEDYLAGTQLMGDGDRLSFVEMGILASAGYDEILVYRRPRIALFVTGDELLEPGEVLKEGKIYDSNLYMLAGRLKELGAELCCAGRLLDEPESVCTHLLEAAEQADAIITTGGVSVGEKDIFHQVLPMLRCDRLFWRVLLKPGTPAMFSAVNGVPMLNLSGNPFAALATFELLGRPMLAQLTADEKLPAIRQTAVMETAFTKESQTRRFVRASWCGGKVTIPQTGHHGSGILASMKGCNCLIDIPAGTKEIKKGEKIAVLLL